MKKIAFKDDLYGPAAAHHFQRRFIYTRARFQSEEYGLLYTAATRECSVHCKVHCVRRRRVFGLTESERFPVFFHLLLFFFFYSVFGTIEILFSSRQTNQIFFVTSFLIDIVNIVYYLQKFTFTAIIGLCTIFSCKLF